MTKPQSMFRLQRLDETMLVDAVKKWTDSDEYNYYLGFGGTGDALLLLANCWDDPKAKVVFFENKSMCKEFFELFDIDVLLHPNIIFSPIGRIVFKEVTSRPTFKISAHLPDELDQSDWSNWKKYQERMITSVPWAGMLGKYENPFPTKGIVVVCPSGGNRDLSRQRFITDYEYRKLCGKLLYQNYTVVTVDSPEHFMIYPKIGHKYNLRCTSSYIERTDGSKENITLETMLKIINAAEFCVSVDTWMVTYCNLNKIPLKLIQTRYQRTYKFGGAADNIFLNPEIWSTMQKLTAEEVCY